jgi:hypothetical protein
MAASNEMLLTGLVVAIAGAGGMAGGLGAAVMLNVEGHGREELVWPGG